MPNRIELHGKQWLHWTVIDYAGKGFWNCQCKCGAMQPVRGKCIRMEQSHRCLTCRVGHNTTHGHASGGKISPTYVSWSAMWGRCTITGTKNYDMYGGSGITVCKRWESFENFLADMGERPPGMQVDRIESKGHYEPGNCKWSTPRQNCQNKRNNRFVSFGSERIVIAEAARRLGMERSVLRAKLIRIKWADVDVATFEFPHAGKLDFPSAVTIAKRRIAGATLKDAASGFGVSEGMASMVAKGQCWVNALPEAMRLCLHDGMTQI